ncbi:MAG TPA: 4-alpha-glucanotransferase [Syntrophales bacterium]|nr:4-alpha-glucanotransferase [Syntrophales bacterium]
MAPRQPICYDQYMEIRFHIPCETAFGETVVVSGPLFCLPLACTPYGVWQGAFSLPAGAPGTLSYRYERHGGEAGAIAPEGGAPRTIDLGEYPPWEVVVLMDRWRGGEDPDRPLYTAPFGEVVFRREERGRRETPVSRPKGAFALRIRAAVPRVPPGWRPALAGSVSALGEWDPRRALPLTPGPYPFWHADLDTAREPFAYKFILRGPGGETLWEEGEDRLYGPPSPLPAAASWGVVVTDRPFRHPGGPWRGAGLAVPLFSLRTNRGMGTGEFPDLIPLAEAAHRLGLRMIQLLPVHDTHDAYPYGILSAFALHPLYLGLGDLVEAGDPLEGEMARTAAALNDLPHLDYEAVMAAKGAFARRIYERRGERTLASEEFRAFFAAAEDWLRPYGAFCRLRDLFGTADHRLWEGYERPDRRTVRRLTDPGGPHWREVAYHYFVQFHLHRQLLAASRHARSLGVCLKGDIPVGVALDSVETWLHPEWFDEAYRIGAPPDDFSTDGQNWGFPAFAWEAMERDGLAFWHRRLRHLRQYFQAVRLDHVIGFARLWRIPADAVTARRGFFHPALPLGREELEREGVGDPEGLCRPRITREVLEGLFGAAWERIASSYLEEEGDGAYRFLPSCATQRETDLAAVKAGEDAGTREALLALHDEVILIARPDGEGDAYHPAIAMERTFAFRALPAPLRERLKAIRDDFYFRRQEPLWEEEARRRLEAVTAHTDLLVCGEDLGMVPSCIPPLLQRLGILGLRVQRMPADLGLPYADCASYPYLTVATPSTHDTAPLRSWWETEDRALIQHYYQNYLGGGGLAPRECPPWVCREIVRRHLESPSLWAVFLLQDLLALDETLRGPEAGAERINDPARPAGNWRWRLHLTLEGLLEAEGFLASVRDLVRAAGRLG